MHSVTRDSCGPDGTRIGVDYGRVADITSEIITGIRHIKDHVDGSGFMKASTTYEWYSPAWFRDSAMVAISLVDAAKYLSDHGHPSEADEAKSLAKSIITFMWSAIGSSSDNMRRGIASSLDDNEFKKLKNHVPARVGGDGSYFSGVVKGSAHSDATERDKDSWLRQYDSVPLVLIATERFVDEFGAASLGDARGQASGLLTLSLEYMLKFYKTECSNAWETENDKLHAYSVSSISRGVRAAKALAAKLGVGIPAALYRAYDSELNHEGIDRFLDRLFVRDCVLYRAKRVFSQNGGFESDPIMELDAAEIFVFTMFKPHLQDYDQVERRTIEAMEAELFAGNVLPVRYLGDTYFDGGRWLLLGLEFASYHAGRGELPEAWRVIDYIRHKYLDGGGGSLPEQEIVNPESPGRDPERYLDKNGGAPISDLAWSEAFYIRAVIAYARASEAAAQEPRGNHLIRR